MCVCVCGLGGGGWGVQGVSVDLKASRVSLSSCCLSLRLSGGLRYVSHSFSPFLYSDFISVQNKNPKQQVVDTNRQFV